MLYGICESEEKLISAEKVAEIRTLPIVQVLDVLPSEVLPLVVQVEVLEEKLAELEEYCSGKSLNLFRINDWNSSLW